ncbi:MAG: DUF4124 domain-containing protein [Gammaproteobacteria bacterium]|nr:DUF4124 domain-containing protein [Gammaproteobacteria bacterium]
MALPLCAFGGVYKWVGPDGNVTYSDKPQPGATEIEMPKFPAVAPITAPVTTAPAASGPTGDKIPPEKKDAKPATIFKSYVKFSIVTPENDATARENDGNVNVELVTEPAWNPQWGHKARVMLDGKPLPDMQTTAKFQLKNIDRGTHSLQATMLDAKGAVLATSQTITFHLKRRSTQFRK